MQIAAIYLYNTSGEIRPLEFKLGGVNIITGAQGTGKSTLIPIIEYCMGRSGPSIKLDDELQRVIAWFAVLFQFRDDQLFVAKPPLMNQQSRGEAFLKIGRTISPPPIDEITINSNDEAVRAEISRRLGIFHKFIADENRTTQDYDLDIDQARFFIFQDSNIITSDKLVFYRQDEQFISQTIKDVLPYFLGVYPIDFMSLKRDEKRLRKELTKQEKKLSALRNNIELRVTRGEKLIAEAQEAGLIDVDVSFNSDQDIFGILRSARGWSPSNSVNIPDNRVPQLREQVNQLYKQLDEVQFWIGHYKQYLQENRIYRDTAEEQATRLSAVTFFDDIDNDVCPVCGNSVKEHMIPSLGSIKRSLDTMRGENKYASLQEPELLDEISKFNSRAEEIKGQIEETELQISSIIGARREMYQNKTLEDQTRHVIGRISYFLEITNYSNQDTSDLETEINRLNRQLEEIDTKLDDEQYEDLLMNIDHIIGNLITNFASALNVEKLGNYTWLDRSSLMLKIQTSNNSVRTLQQIGSTGKNHLPYHIALMLALHSYFVENDRPVPRFIIFDQPSAPYYPDETYDDDEDREQVRRIFDLLFQVTQQLHPHLQIIVLEHANEKEWEDFLVDKPWRDGNALIWKRWLD